MILGLVVGMTLKLYTIVAIPTFVKVTEGKLVGGVLLVLPYPE